MIRRMLLLALVACLACAAPLVAGAEAVPAGMTVFDFWPEDFALDSLVALPDGGLLAGGSCIGSAGDSGYAMRLSADGALLWSVVDPADVLLQALGQLGEDHAAILRVPVEDPYAWTVTAIGADGLQSDAVADNPSSGEAGLLRLTTRGFLRGGYTAQLAFFREPMGSGDGVALLDGNLDEVWYLADSLAGCSLLALCEAEDGLLLAGSWEPAEDGPLATRAVARKIGWDGGLIWRYDGAQYEGFVQATDICPLPNGGALITLDDDPLMTDRADTQSAVVRLSEDGEPLWALQVGEEGARLRMHAVRPLGDAGYVVYARAADEPILLLVDEAGNKLAEAPMPAPADARIETVQLVDRADGSVLACGTLRLDGGEGALRLYTLRLTPEGFLQPDGQ